MPGYQPWSPDPVTLRVLAQVNTVLEEYAAHLPLTIRQIFYRLVGAHGYPKLEKDYKNLCRYLKRARRAKMIPMSAIRDDYTAHTPYTHAGVDPFMLHIYAALAEKERLVAQGVPNKINKTTKEAMEEAAQIVGGKEGKVGVFVKAGQKDIVAFANMMARGMTLEVKAEVNNIAPLRDVYIVGVPPGHSKGPDGMIRPWSESEALWKAKGLTPPAIVYDEPRLVSDNNTETFDADYIEADEVQRPQLDDLEPLLPAKPEVKRDAQGVVIVDVSSRRRKRRTYGLFGD